MNKLKKIPLFPLNIVVLPKEEIPLHIFEDRYKKMIDNCLEKKLEFGIIYMKNNNIEDIGCSILISKVLKKHTSGKYDLICKGSKRFRIKKVYKSNDLWQADVEYLNEDYAQINKDYFDKILDKYLKIIIAVSPNINFQAELKKNTSFDFTKNVILPREIKQLFLNLRNEESRLEFINDFLDSFSTVRDDTKKKQKKILN